MKAFQTFLSLSIALATMVPSRALASCSVTLNDLEAMRAVSVCGSGVRQSSCAIALADAGLLGGVIGGAWAAERERQLRRLATIENRVREGLGTISPWSRGQTNEERLIRNGLRTWIADEASRIQPTISRDAVEAGIRRLEEYAERRGNETMTENRHDIARRIRDSASRFRELLEKHPGAVPTREMIAVADGASFSRPMVLALIMDSPSGGRQSAEGRALRGLLHWNNYLEQSFISLKNMETEIEFADGRVLRGREFRHLVNESIEDGAFFAGNEEQHGRSLMSRLRNAIYGGIRSGVMEKSRGFEQVLESRDDVQDAMRVILNGRSPDELARSFLETTHRTGWREAGEWLAIRAQLGRSAQAAARLGARAAVGAAAHGGRAAGGVVRGAFAGTGAAGLAFLAAEFTLIPTGTACSGLGANDIPRDSNCRPTTDDESANVLSFLDRGASGTPDEKAEVRRALQRPETCAYYAEMKSRLLSARVTSLTCGRQSMAATMTLEGQPFDLQISVRPEDDVGAEPIRQVRAASRFGQGRSMVSNSLFKADGEPEVLTGGTRNLRAAAHLVAARAVTCCRSRDDAAANACLSEMNRASGPATRAVERTGSD